MKTTIPKSIILLLVILSVLIWPACTVPTVTKTSTKTATITLTTPITVLSTVSTTERITVPTTERITVSTTETRTSTVTTRITDIQTSTTTVRSTVTSTVKTTVTAATTSQPSTMTSQPTTTPFQSTTTTSQPSTVPASYSVQEALAFGLIDIKINGFVGVSIFGASSGDVIVIKFLRLKAEKMKIVVPLGTTLACSDSAKQNMVIFMLKGRDPDILGYYPVNEIILDKDEWKDFLFEAYCLDMNKGNILNSTTFSIGGPASPEIIAMLSAVEVLDAEIATIKAVQIAIWALTDNPTLEELNKRFDTAGQDIANAWTILDKAGLDPGSKRLFAGYTPV